MIEGLREKLHTLHLSEYSWLLQPAVYTGDFQILVFKLFFLDGQLIYTTAMSLLKAEYTHHAYAAMNKGYIYLYE